MRPTIERDTFVYVWEVQSGEMLLRMPLGRWDYSRAVAMEFAANGNSLALAGPNLVVVDVAAGTIRHTIPGHKDGEWSVSHHPTKQLLVSGGDTLRFWDPVTGQKRGQAAGQRGWALAFAPNGETLAVSSGQAVSLRSVHGLKEVAGPIELGPARALGTFKSTALRCAFSPDGKSVLVGTHVGECRLYDVGTGKLLHQLADGKGSTAAVAFVDGRAVAATTGNHACSVRLWDVADGEELFAERRFDGNWTIAFSPHGQVLISGGDAVNFWDIRTGRRIHNGERDARIHQFVLMPNREEVAAVGSRVSWWNLSDGKLLRTLQTKADYNYGPRLFPDGRTLAVPIIEYENRGNDPFNPLMRMRGIALIDAEKEVEIGRLAATLPSLSISPDGRTLAAFGNGVEFWDAIRQVRFHEWGDRSSVGRVTFSPDGHYAAISQGERVTVWEVATRRSLRSWKISPNDVHDGYPAFGVASAFSPDGRCLVTGTPRGPIYLWDLDSGDQLAAFRGHLGNIASLAFRRDGRVLASVSADRTALLWDVADCMPPIKRERLPAGEVDRFWAQLASSDPSEGQEAVARLSAGGDGVVAELGKRMTPSPPLNAARLAKLIDDLDSDAFPTRRAASVDLAALGELAEPKLRQARLETKSEEVRRQIDVLLAHPVHWSNNALRLRRAIRVLERIGGDGAIKTLRRMASGAPESRNTHDAKSAIERMTH